MRVETIQKLFEYQAKMNNDLLDCLSDLSDEKFQRDHNYAWGSVHGLAVHVMGGEWVWIRRMQGFVPRDVFTVEEYPTLDTMKTKWLEVNANTKAFLATLTDDTLYAPFTYKNTDGAEYTNTTCHILLHIINHSTEHRAQLYIMMHDMGERTGDQDLINMMW